jgi:hypothetical protein
MGFKEFLIESEKMEEDDLKKTLHKIPAEHRKLVKGYGYQTQGGNTLKGDNEHIGFNDLSKHKIVLAAPWNYGREFALLHEIGHMVWEKYISPNPEKKKEWMAIVKKTKDKVHQNAEEVFCHAYANHYVKNKIVIHTHDKWEKFIKSLN